MECGICKTKLTLIGNKKMRKKKYLMIKQILRKKLSENLLRYTLDFLGEGVFVENNFFIIMFWNCSHHPRVFDFLTILENYFTNDIEAIESFFKAKKYNDSLVFSFFENINIKLILNAKHDNHNLSLITFYLNEMFVFFYKKHKTNNLKPLVNLVEYDRNQIVLYYFQKRFNLVSNLKK